MDPSVAANDDLSPFERWWVDHGGNPDLRAWEVAQTVGYHPALPQGNRATWPRLAGHLAPTLIEVMFNRDPNLTLRLPDLDALAEWSLLAFRYGNLAQGFPYRAAHRPVPDPTTVTWSADDLDALWASWAHEQGQHSHAYRLTHPNDPSPPPTPLERLHLIAHAAWERFQRLPVVQAHPCDEATYWALIQDAAPGLARVEDRYAARFTPPPRGQILPFRPRWR